MTVSARGTVGTVDDVLITDELRSRPARVPDFEGEARSQSELAEVMAESPEKVFQALAETALRLCRAGSSGISVWDQSEPEVFRWRAVAGAYASYLGGTLPRDFSPCGTVLDRGGVHLMANPARFFPYIRELSAPISEVLLVPFSQRGHVVGTMWIVSHDERRFDAEDVRVITSLTRFAAAAVEMLERIQTAERAEQGRQEAQLRLEATLATGEVATWTWDIKADRVVADRNLAYLFGVSEADAQGGPIAGYIGSIHPDDRASTETLIQQAILDHTQFEAHYRVRNADGEYRSVIARGRPEYDQAGNAVRLPGVVLDITRQLRTETQLRASDEKFRTLFETMDEGFCIVDVEFDENGRSIDYRHIEANPAFEKHTGLRDALGKSVRETFPALEDFWFQTYGQVAKTGEPTRFQHFAGPLESRWFDVYASRVGGPGSNRVAILFNDITQRKIAEEKISASEARNSFLVKLADTLRPLSDPIAIQAEASRVLGERLRASRAVYFEVRGDKYVVERDYASGVASVVGQHTIASFGPDQLATYKAGQTAVEADVNAFPARPAEEKAAFAGVQIRSYIGVPLVKGGVFAAGLAVHSNCVQTWTPTEIAITEDTAERTWAAVERARAEAALRASEERRRMALDSAELGAWSVDPETMTLTTDDRFRAIFGINSDRVSYEQAVGVIHPDDQERVRDAVADATRPDDPEPYAVEYRVIHQDGSIHWVFAKGRANIEESERKLVSFDGTVTDITARKEAEQERERLVRELREQDRRKDEFLATLAHELRNPLAPIRNGLQVLRLGGATGEMADNARTMMERQLGQMVHLIDDLLDLSRISSGKIELRKARVELAKVIQQAVETSSPQIEASGHELTIDLPSGVIYVDADVTRLAQVFSNLLNNAAKYTERGGHVHLAVQRQDGEVIVSVKDNGLGIPAHMLPKVFEMFTQVDRHLERSQGGLGIGLSIVKRLVEMHGGSVSVESNGPGTGSEFKVLLPVVLSMALTNEIRTETNQTLCVRKILVVDDNVDAAVSLAMMLKLMGNEAKTAHDGLEAIQVAAVYKPDLILLDIGMPRLNGHETAKRIREQPWGKDVILVALTGWGQEEDRLKSEQAGFDAHMVKPIEPAALETLLLNVKVVTA